MGVEFGVEVEACHYQPGWVVDGGWWVVGGWTKTKLMLFSTQVEVVVELKLELGLAKSLMNYNKKVSKYFSDIISNGRGEI